MSRRRPKQHGALRKAFQNPKSCAAANGSLPGVLPDSAGQPTGSHQRGLKIRILEAQAPAKQPARSPIAGGLLGGLRAGRRTLSASANRTARGGDIYTSIFSVAKGISKRKSSGSSRNYAVRTRPLRRRRHC
jgi:hypothetical protein